MKETNKEKDQPRNRVMYKAAIGQAAVMIIEGTQWSSPIPHNAQAVERINQVIALLSGKRGADGGIILRLTRSQRLEVTEAMERRSGELALLVEPQHRRRFVPRHWERLKSAADEAYALWEHLNRLQS